MPGISFHVAIGVISNNTNQVILSRRPTHVHQGDFWEFPGGKLELGETARDALYRELYEELDLCVDSARPLMRIHHDYGKYSVLLDVWQVTRWHSASLKSSGLSYGKEGQLVEWVDIRRLPERNFPAANMPIIKAIQLPDIYLICPLPEHGYNDYINRFELCLQAGIRLFQLRFGDNREYDNHRLLVVDLLRLSALADARLLINSSLTYAREIGAQGVHLSSTRLMRLKTLKLKEGFMVSASCHNSDELKQADKQELDFVVLSPVRCTLSHPSAIPLGWDIFSSLVESLTMPVYALGGMHPEDLPVSRNYGAQGIAVLGNIWNGDKVLMDIFLDEYSQNKSCL